MNLHNLPKGSRRYLDIARKLGDDIDTGLYTAGQRLPPERELAQALDASRTTVREALLALEIMRFIEIRVGAGVFVLDEAHRNVPGRSQPDTSSPSDVLEARRILEGETAARAAQNATENDIAMLNRNVLKMAASIDDIARFDAADAQFHAEIARISRNDVIVGLVTHLWKMRESNMWSRWYDQTRNPKNRRRSVDDHQTIVKAIERHLPDAARTAMQTHLDVLADRFYELKL